MAEQLDMSAFDALFGDVGYEAYLNGLTSKGAPTAGLAPAQVAQPKQADTTTRTERVLTDDEKRFGSYGTVNDIGNVNLTDVASVAEMAKRGGWADPYAFNTDMLDMGEFGPGSIQKGGSGGDGGIDWPTYVKFKDPASRGITDTGRNLNRVEVVPDKKVFSEGETAGADDYTVTPGGYKVLAGAVPGTKTHTALYYQYGKDGKFQGANFDAEESFAQGVAPLVSMAGMALGMGGGLASLGGSINTGLGLGLSSPTAIGALGGGAIGAGTAVLTGQNVLKGAALGATGGGLTAMNPAGMIGIDKAFQPVANGAIVGGAKAVMTGQDPLVGAASGGINGAMRGLFPTKGRA